MLKIPECDTPIYKCSILNHFDNLKGGTLNFLDDMTRILNFVIVDKTIEQKPIQLQELSRYIETNISDTMRVCNFNKFLGLVTADYYGLQLKTDSSLLHLERSFNSEISSTNPFAAIIQLKYFLELSGPKVVLTKFEKLSES